ncbi:RICIN domain-containing protein [Pseudonocardia sp. GCM10023141]|uniref:RICIN domain-containing protein n=1 Tax=Pseudonocardia sp. GCM10023141 TaxID=3252653 RepID=UPI0036119167
MSIHEVLGRAMAATAAAAATMITGAVVMAAPAQAAVPAHEIVGIGSGKCLDVRAEDGGAGARIQTWQCFGSANQEWGVQFVGKYTGVDYFQLISKGPGGLCMEVSRSANVNGAQIDQAECSQDANKLFRLDTGNGGFTLRPMSSTRCVDVSGNSTLNGAKVQLWDCNETTAQAFRLV